MEAFRNFISGIGTFFAILYRGGIIACRATWWWLMTIPKMVITFVWWPLAVAFKRWPESQGFGRIALSLYMLFVAWLPLGMVSFVGYFFVNTLYIRNMDYDYVENLSFETFSTAGTESVATEGDARQTKTCARSAIVDTTAYLIDFNVNQNEWTPGLLAYKIGPFGLALVNSNWTWDITPWFDNKASFQRGIHRAVDRVSIELVDNLGRQRGTSERNELLAEARGNIQIPEGNWWLGDDPIGFKQTSWGSYEAARKQMLRYNANLAQCNAVFDARADNLKVFLDRMAKDIGSVSAVIKSRAESNDSGWFDTRADNLFMETQGMLYAYYGILQAAGHDFEDVIKTKELGEVWTRIELQLRAAIELSPLIIANGAEDAFLMPSHLTTQGFYVLRIRSNLVEMRGILEI